MTIKNGSKRLEHFPILRVSWNCIIIINKEKINKNEKKNVLAMTLIYRGPSRHWCVCM